MGINRYSSPVQVAQFDPLTAAEVMKVPLAKQAMENEQMAQKDTMLSELYNMRSTQADSEKINAKKAELEGELNALVNDISSRGINSRSTQALANLKSKYIKELSLSGDIGQANAYVTMQEQARKEFQANKLNFERGTDRANKIWNESVKGRSAFNEDNSYKTEFENVGTPQYYNPEDELDSIKLGIITDYENYQIKSKTNQQQIDSAIEGILLKYAKEGSPENASMKADGYTLEDVKARLEKRGEALLIDADGTITNKQVTAPKSSSQIAADKKTLADYNKAKAIAEERTLKEGDSFIDEVDTPDYAVIASDITKTGQELAAMTRQWQPGTPKPDAMKAQEDLLRTQIETKNTWRRVYTSNDPQAAENFDNLERSLTGLNNPRLESDIANGRAEVVSTSVGYRVVVPGSLVPGSSGLWPKPNVMEDLTGNYFTNEDDVIGLAEVFHANKKFEDGFALAMHKDSKAQKITITPEIFQSSYSPTRTQKVLWEQNAGDVIASSPNSFIVEEATIGDTKLKNKGDESDEDFSRRILQEITSVQTGVKNNFKVISLLPPTSITGAGMIVQTKLPDADGTMRVANVRINLGKDPNPAARSIFTTGLGKFNNYDLNTFAEQVADEYNYDFAIPSAKYDHNFTNADNYDDYFSRPKLQDSKGYKLINQHEGVKDELEVFRTDRGEYQMKVRSGADQKIYDFKEGTLGNMLLPYFDTDIAGPDSTDPKKPKRLPNNAMREQDYYAINRIMAYAESLKYREGFPDRTLTKEQIATGLAKGRYSEEWNTPLITNSEVDFVKLLE